MPLTTLINNRLPLAVVWLSSVVLSCNPGCGRGDAATSPGLAAVAPQKVPQVEDPSPPAKLPGDRLAYRFVDHAGEARLELPGQSLQAAWTSFRHPYKLPSPYSGLRGETALRAVEIALADADVAGYGGTADKKAAQPLRMPRFDPVWNRARAVYQSKSSLFAPAGSRYVYKLRLPKQGLLSLSHAAVPPAGVGGPAPVEFSVEINGQSVYKKVLSGESGGRWHEAEIPLSGDLGKSDEKAEKAKEPAVAEVAFVTKATAPGAPVGMPVWGDPLLWAKDEGTPGPNFLFIVIDTLRADALDAMPNLQAYAKKGTRFSQAITAATWTRPSILSMLGGDLPTAIGQSAEAIIPPDAERRRFYALGPTLLPRLMRARGWRTTAIGNNFFLLGYPQIGLDLGFEEVADVRHPVLDTPAITRAAVDFLRKNQGRPFFLHLHYDAPHWPYTPPPNYLSEVKEGLSQRLTAPEPGEKGSDPQAKAYLGEAAYADGELKTVLDELTRLKLDSRTLVVIVGDHGEIFDPRHSHFVVSLGLSTLYHHGWTAYDELLKVPLIFRMPSKVPEGRDVAEQVRLTDIAPTALELLGLPREALPGGGRGRGRSLMPLMKGESEEERIAFVEGQNIKAVRGEGFAYLRRSDGRLQRAVGSQGAGPVVEVSEELYDLRKDPHQHSNLAMEPKAQQQLLRMRTLFEQEMPRPPDRNLPVLHIRVAPHGKQAHRVTGTVATAGANLAIRSVSGGELRPDAPNRLMLSLSSGGGVDLLVDPEARLELQLAVDGAPLAPSRILLGPYALPLLSAKRGEGDGTGTLGALPGAVPLAVIDGALLSRLDAQHPPVLGDRGDVLVWRDQGAATPLAATSTEGAANPDDGEIAGMMRNWGYAQGGKDGKDGKDGKEKDGKESPRKDESKK